MEILNDMIKKKIKEHADEELPNECCGLVISSNGDRTLMKCKNVAQNPRDNFQIAGKEYIEASAAGKIIAYYHSHPEDEVGVFSESDKAVSRGHGISLILFSVKNKKFLQYN
jgi:proteasome lid subunit RPN8/RPN11